MNINIASQFHCSLRPIILNITKNNIILVALIPVDGIDIVNNKYTFCE